MLTRHAPDINMAKTVDILPPTWPLEIIAKALLGNMRNTMATERKMKIKKGLAKSENLQVHRRLMEEHNRTVIMGEYSTCPICDLPFGEASFVRYPNGVTTHHKCSRERSVCPLTGKWFQADKVLPSN